MVYPVRNSRLPAAGGGIKPCRNCAKTEHCRAALSNGVK
jgi:hypothetical protein